MQKLIKTIDAIVKPTIAGIDYISMPRFRKTSRATGERIPEEYLLIHKVHHGQVMIGNSYERAVRNRQLKETGKTDFHTRELPWGRWYGENHNLIEHSGCVYLRCYLMSRNPMESFYQYPDKTIATGHHLAEYLPPPKAGSGRQAVDNAIIVNCIKLQNIRWLSIGEFTYRA